MSYAWFQKLHSFCAETTQLQCIFPCPSYCSSHSLQPAATLHLQVGLVFQFPERHFLGDDVMAEMTFTWPRDVAYWGQRQSMAVRMQRVSTAAGL
jgi:energy-coupling factor transporter ATP-binding protein EcfA2